VVLTKAEKEERLEYDGVSRTMETAGEGDRRMNDRRKRPAKPISKYVLTGGRRKSARRKADKREYIFVDRYSPLLLAPLLFLLILGISDAYLTLVLIKYHGMAEANPIMALCLACGEISFIVQKFLITIATILVLCLCSNFFIARLSLASSIMIYLAVVLYELNAIYKLPVSL
jgi:hypothetical protein